MTVTVQYHWGETMTVTVQYHLGEASSEWSEVWYVVVDEVRVSDLWFEGYRLPYHCLTNQPADTIKISTINRSKAKLVYYYTMDVSA